MIRGADFSAYQDTAHVDAAIAEGIRFAFVKLTEGQTYVNPDARWQLERLRAHGVALGVYHYLAPSGAHQWEHFQMQLERLPEHERLVVALDYEAANTTDADAAAFIAAGRRAGYQVGCYSSRSTHAYARLGQAWRWVAQWISKGYPATPPPRTDFWQWAAGAGGGPDWDLFVGSEAALERFWARYAGHGLYRLTVAAHGHTAAYTASYRSAKAAAAAGVLYALRHPSRRAFTVTRLAP